MLATPENNIPTTTKPRKRNSSRWFKRDSNAESDPKIMALIQSNGWEAVAWYWLTVGALRDAAEFSLTREELGILAWKFRIDGSLWESFIAKALELGLFTEVDGEILSERLLQDMEEMSERGRRAGKASAVAKSLDSQETDKSERVSTHVNVCQRPLTAVDVSQRRSTDNLISSDLIRSRSSFGRGGPGEKPPDTPEPLPPPVSEIEQLAETALEPCDSERVARSRVFLTAGRRPLRKYPNVWLSRPEFCQMLGQYEAAGVVKTELKHLLQVAESKGLEAKTKGQDPEMKPWFGYLTGWILEDYLKKRKASLDAKRSQNWLEQSMEAAKV